MAARLAAARDVSKELDSLREEHALLRDLSGRLRRALGERSGVGWDDCGRVDMAAMRAAQRELQERQREHERREERLVRAALGRRGEGPAVPSLAVERAHASLESAAEILSALACVCDGLHLHAVRTAAERLLRELEAHMAYEEAELFPLLGGRPGGGSKAL